jgi:hypothetical protein
MAITGFFHHIGTFLMFVATVLLIVTDISAPVVHDIALLKVNLANSTDGHFSSVTFGTFGYCIINTAADNKDFCTPSMVGYSPSDYMTSVEPQAHYNQDAHDSTNALTKVMILHPVATGICFISFLLTLGAGVVGSLLASIVAVIAFIVTVVVLITDFVLFSIIKSGVNNDNTGSVAYYSTGLWTILAAAILTLIAAVIIFLSCCSARLHHRRTTTNKVDGYAEPTRRRRFF